MARKKGEGSFFLHKHHFSQINSGIQTKFDFGCYTYRLELFFFHRSLLPHRRPFASPPAPQHLRLPYSPRDVVGPAPPPPLRCHELTPRARPADAPRSRRACPPCMPHRAIRPAADASLAPPLMRRELTPPPPCREPTAEPALTWGLLICERSFTKSHNCSTKWAFPKVT